MFGNNINEFSRVLGNIIFSKKKKILKKINYYQKQIVEYDKDNKKFNFILKKIIDQK
jgi:hypothetical protein